MARYVVKPGHKAFIDGALRSEGYEFVREKAYKKVPEHLGVVTAKPKAKAPKAKAPKADAGKAGAPVNFMSDDDETQDIATSGKTVQL